MAEHERRWRTGLGRRAGTVARWPLGMALTSWRYLWRITALHRVDVHEGPADPGPPLPAAVVDDRVQPIDAGVGAVFHRCYGIEVEQPHLTPEQLLAAIAADPNRPAPVEVAVFRKTAGDPGPLAVGDEFLVRMPGPWDGPVRVVDVTPTSFRFVTLRGHLEAGQIEFRTSGDRQRLRFAIESWARSGDRLSDLLYDRLRLAKEMQLHMWTFYCERAARLAGGTRRGGVTIVSHRADG